MLLPKDNAKDLADIPAERLAGLDVVEVDTVAEVLHHAFGGDVLNAS